MCWPHRSDTLGWKRLWDLKVGFKKGTRKEIADCKCETFSLKPREGSQRLVIHTLSLHRGSGRFIGRCWEELLNIPVEKYSSKKLQSISVKNRKTLISWQEKQPTVSKGPVLSVPEPFYINRGLRVFSFTTWCPFKCPSRCPFSGIFWQKYLNFFSLVLPGKAVLVHWWWSSFKILPCLAALSPCTFIQHVMFWWRFLTHVYNVSSRPSDFWVNSGEKGFPPSWRWQCSGENTHEVTLQPVGAHKGGKKCEHSSTNPLLLHRNEKWDQVAFLSQGFLNTGCFFSVWHWPASEEKFI